MFWISHPIFGHRMHGNQNRKQSNQKCINGAQPGWVISREILAVKRVTVPMTATLLLCA